MKFTIDKNEQFCLMTLEEERLNSLCAPKLKSELVLLNAEGIKNIILDLNNVTFIDSSGLSSLLVGNRLCKDAGGVFVMTNISHNPLKLIRISQLEAILNIIPSNSEAKDFVLMGELEKDFKEDGE